jgi:hypothetical protein
MKKALFNILLLSVNFSFAQSVSVAKIEENRSTGTGSFSNNIKIELIVSGDEVRKYKSIKLETVTKAFDDQGIDLFKKNTFGDSYKPIEIDGKIEVELQKASRKALTIKTLEGTINLYNPTVENKGIVEVKNFTSKTNQNLLPATFPLKLLYLTKESLTKYKADMQKKKEEDIKKLPELQKKMAETLLGIFDNMDSFGDPKTEVTFLRDGLEDKLIDVYFLNKAGEKIERNGYYSSGQMITYPFSKEIQPDWTMVLNIETDLSIKKIPFKLANVILP